MGPDWSRLRDPAPGSLVQARELAHWAAQWATKAARANLPAAPDDSHSALCWDDGLQAFVSQPMGGTKVGLHVASLEMIVLEKAKPLKRLVLDGMSASAVDEWLDMALAKAGLQPASGVKLPYDVPKKDFSSVKSERERLAAIGLWFAAAADLLAEVRQRYAGYAPGPSASYLWPHHFDLATLVSFDAKGEKSIGIGVSPGDHYYAQPYLYVSTYPAPQSPKPPALPAGHWHTKDFFGAVATADELLAQPDPRNAALAAIDAAFNAGKG